ncbi:MAG: (2Fe-2S)-binding protein [Anaerolineales bacterium]|nr:(2Fe-2S)-binding protein [Anaerolineales bacterium]
MQLTINGRPYDVADDSGQTLLWVLRDELGLTGTKFGCGAGICGACTVQVDGEAVRSCITTVGAVAGKAIRTVEDLAVETADGPRLHPVQQAFIEQQVPQCSWCMSGQMMTALAFLEKNPAPAEAEIVTAMGENYCRCGCYGRIKTAVSRAAELMATEDANA